MDLISSEIRKCTQLMKIDQNLWDTLLRRKTITLNTYINLSFHSNKVCARVLYRKLEEKKKKGSILLRCQSSLNWSTSQHSPNQNTRRVICRNWEADSKMYVEMQSNWKRVLERDTARKLIVPAVKAFIKLQESRQHIWHTHKHAYQHNRTET